MYRALRLGWRFTTVALVNGGSLLIAAYLIPGITIEREVITLLGAAIFALLIGLANALIRPMLVYLVQPANILTIGVPTVIVDALLLLAMDRLLPGFRVDQFWPSALLGAVIMPACNVILSSLTNPERHKTVYDFVLRQLGRKGRGEQPQMAHRGMIILQLDGISYVALREGLRRGRLPAIQALLDAGGHALLAWDPGIPTQTSSVQAGLLYGENHDIPAFRWFDRQSLKVLISNRPEGAGVIEERLAHNAGLLEGGSSINTLISGGASTSIFTVSRIRSGEGVGQRVEELLLFLLNPYCLLRVAGLSVLDLLVEHVGALRGRLRRDLPRVSRQGLYPFFRIMSNIVLRELSTYFALLDIMRGVPAIYVSYLGYDEVCHFAGPRSPDVHGPLEGIDSQVRRIRKALSRDAPISYDLILLSDHGQTESIPFSQRYGQGLGDLVACLVAGEAPVRAGDQGDELPGQLLALLEELQAAERLSSGRLVPLAMSRGRQALGRAGSRRLTSVSEADEEQSGFLVLPSGNLAHIYLARDPKPLSLEEIERRHPLLVTELARHPGIGFVVGRSELRGPLVIGARGFRRLEDGLVVGDDPLEPFGDPCVIAGHVLRLMRFANAGDLVVNSLFREGRVAAFEEHVGTHGGVGGPQNQPFLLYPADMRLEPARIANAQDLYPVFMAWKGEKNGSI